MYAARLLCPFLFAASLLIAQSPGFSVADALSAPFSSDLLTSSDGKTAVWVQNRQGLRNIWIATAPEWKGRELTHFAEDDGQEIAQLAFSPDSQTLYFTRGGDFENGGESPNPDYAADTPDQSVWSVATSGSELRKLLVGQIPAPRPNAATYAFVRKHQIFFVEPTAKVPELAFTDEGTPSQLTWSPDGKLLAFTSHRRDHGFIGLYRPETHALEYLDATTGTDSNPTWSPDSRQLAFIRVPPQPRTFAPARTAQPWSLHIHNVETHGTRQLFLADSGPGSAFRELGSDLQLLWAANNQIVFPWERTGWLHLYSIAATGGQPLELTPGQGEVEDAVLSSDRQSVLYTSNIADIDRRHLWQRALSPQATPKPVTAGEGIEWHPVPAFGNTLLALESTVQDRASAALVTGTQTVRRLAPESVPANYPGAQFVTPEAVLLTATDGLRIHAQLFRPPPSVRSDRHPALLFFHGGSRRQMLLGSHYRPYYSNAYALNQYLASRGYIVLSVNYRSGIGYGLDFREALHYGPYGGSEYNDVVGAGLYLRSRPDVDSARIGVWGGSYGGYLTAMALARDSALFAAGVDFHGVHDWSTERSFTVTTGNPAEIEAAHTAARVAYQSSPMASIEGWRSPVLLIHGDDDRNVQFHQTVELSEELSRRHVPFEQLIFPNEIHDFLRHQDWLRAYAATVDFFNRHLQAYDEKTSRSSGRP